MKVSIPFKRESISEPGGSGRVYSTVNNVSIPFKRESISELPVQAQAPTDADDKFQFPSNGKVYLNSLEQSRRRGACCHVSIPFKRESISELTQKAWYLETPQSRFNSLQTGKYI